MISLGAWWWTSSTAATPATPPPAPSLAAHPEPAARLTVHVAGEVTRPGVVRLDPGARVVDAIEAAGGATTAAVLSGVNLAAEVVDGAQIIVPSRLPRAGSALSPDDGIVAVNTATASDLETLPGVGPVLAGRIVAHREESGPFSAVEDLLDVAGIGETTLSRLRPLIRIP